MPESSPKGKMFKGDWQKVGKGALIAAVGAIAASLYTAASGSSLVIELNGVSMDISPFLGAIASVVVNMVRKWQTGPSS